MGKRLWSLLEMLTKFEAAAFTVIIANLSKLAMMLTDLPGKLDEKTASIVTDRLAETRAHFNNLPLSDVVIASLDRIQTGIPDKHTGAAVKLLTEELIHNVINDIGATCFLMIPANQRANYEQLTPVFGEDVAKRFPDATFDIASAGRCLALDEWTACVLHLMRAVELGLQDIGTKLNVLLPKNKAIDLGQWGELIDAIEIRLGELRHTKSSVELEPYSKAALQFGFFKDAWRNHAGHARGRYDDKDAPVVFTSVKAFMQQLAALP